MALSRTRGFLAAGLVLLTALALIGKASGDEVIGTNAVLDANSHSFYIALQPGTSGVFGDTLGGGDLVGLQADTVSLTANGETTGGEVSFILDFDISGSLGPGQVVNEDTAHLGLRFDDIDFKADVYGTTAVLLEMLDLTFLPDAGAVPGPVDLTIDATNYGLYSNGGFVQTDNSYVSYDLHLRDDLGLGAADFAGINDDGKFAMLFEFNSLLTHTRSSFFGGDSFTNTPEGVRSKLCFQTVPEPGSFMLLGSGIVLLLRRRRRS